VVVGLGGLELPTKRLWATSPSIEQTGLPLVVISWLATHPKWRVNFNQTVSALSVSAAKIPFPRTEATPKKTLFVRGYV